LEIKRQLGDKSDIASSLGNIGRILIRRGKYEEAFPYVLLAYNISENLRGPLEEAQYYLTTIKNAVGEEKYQKLASEANRQLFLL
jgi:hypothetical protein